MGLQSCLMASLLHNFTHSFVTVGVARPVSLAQQNDEKIWFFWNHKNASIGLADVLATDSCWISHAQLLVVVWVKYDCAFEKIGLHHRNSISVSSADIEQKSYHNIVLSPIICTPQRTMSRSSERVFNIRKKNLDKGAKAKRRAIPNRW